MTRYLLSKKVASSLLVIAMLLSTFSAVFMAISDEGSAASTSFSEDIVIGEGGTATMILTGDNYLNGNVTVGKGGVLKVLNGSLTFCQDTGMDDAPGGDVDHVYTLTVEDGGVLIMENSVLNTRVDLINDFPSLGVLIRNGATFQANDSVIQFPGHMMVDDANLILRGTTVKGHDPTEVATFCNGVYFPSDAFDDAPVMMFISSNVEIYDSYLYDVYENVTETNFYDDYPAIYSHSYPFVADDINRTTVTYLVERLPMAIGASSGDGVVDDLTCDDDSYYSIEADEELLVDMFDPAGVVFADGEADVVLHASYWTETGFTGADLEVGFEDGAFDQTVGLTDTSFVYPPGNAEETATIDLSDMSTTDLAELNVRVNNSGGSTIHLEKIWVTIEFALDTYRSITAAGSTELTVVNSFLEADYTDRPERHTTLDLYDASHAYLYGVTLNNTDPIIDQYQPAINVHDTVVEFYASSIGIDDNTGEEITSLLEDDGTNYDVGLDEVMDVTDFNVTGFDGIISAATLNVEYTTNLGYVDGPVVQWAFSDQNLTNTSIVPSNPAGSGTYNIFAQGVNSVEDISSFIAYFNNSGTGGILSFDKLWIEVTYQPTVYIYKWMNLTVVNGESTPVHGAEVSSSLQRTSEAAYYVSSDGKSNIPPTQLLSYLGKTAETFDVTDINGNAAIPLLVDMIYSSTLPNSFSVGSYDVTVSFDDGSSWYNVSTSVSFTSYPCLEGEEAMVSEVTVEIEDIVINGLRLGGTEEIALVGTTFNCTGDVVIEDNAVLTIESSIFNLWQQTAYQSNIIVRDSGSLVIIGDSLVKSNKDMNVIAEDLGTICVTDEGAFAYMVDVIADGSSQIIYADTTMDSSLTAPETSYAMIECTNVTFTQSNGLLLSGSAAADLTNVALNGYVVLGDATMTVSKWLTVTLFDGTGNELPGGYVGLSFLGTGEAFDVGMTDDNGTVTFKALGHEVDSIGTRFVGNYLVNATYWYEMAAYENDVDGIVSLDASSVPFIIGGSSASVTIESALPDVDPPFYVLDSEGVAVNQTFRTDVLNLSAEVSNLGVVAAQDLVVRFLDGDDIIEDVVVDVAPGETITVSAAWTADLPLGEHVLYVVVDPENEIPELNETNNENSTAIEVFGVAELSLLDPEISVLPSSPTSNTSAIIYVTVENSGDVNATSFVIHFYADDVLINSVSAQLPEGENILVSQPWTPTMPGEYVVRTVIELDEMVGVVLLNNEAALNVTVLDYADLAPIELEISQASPVSVGTYLLMDATITNLGETTATNVLVRYWLGGVDGELLDTVVIDSIEYGESVVATGEWVVQLADGRMASEEIVVEVNPALVGMTLEKDYDNNLASLALTIVDDRPDVSIEGLNVTSSGVEIDTASVGQTVRVNVELANEGYASAVGTWVEIHIIDENSTSTYIGNASVDLSDNGTASFNLTWSVNVTEGSYTLMVIVDPYEVLGEGDVLDNVATIDFNVTAAIPAVTIALGSYSFDADTSAFIQGRVTNDMTGDALAGVPVKVQLIDSSGMVIAESNTVQTGTTGAYTVQLYIPTGAEGDFVLRAIAGDGDNIASQNVGIDVEGAFQETSQPWWVWLIIAAVVVAIIVGFSYYLYKYGLGKMVECGECGSLIPESSKRCPNCGVTFESGTAKCSECGAWIPTNATKCPECGAKFMSDIIDEDENAYIEQMRQQYDEFVDGYREEAKAELENKYSDAKFLTWWQKHPSFMSFEDWLSKEEERKKTGAFPCPVCGTLNAKDSQVCHKCGTVFDLYEPKEHVHSEEPPAEEKRPLRRIVRRRKKEAEVSLEIAADGGEAEVGAEVPEEPVAEDEE